MKKKRYMEGSITVYGALTFVILLSLVLAVIEGARENTACMKLECAMDLSLYSVFAEYNRPLYEQYDLFFIDASYGQKGASPVQIGEHLRSYMDDNFRLNQQLGVKKDLLAMQTEDVNVLNYSLASDEKGLLLKRQAVSYMKDVYGISYIKDLTGQLKTVEGKRLLTRDITKERLSNQNEIDSYEIPPRQIDENTWEEVELNNPADGINGTRGNLALVFGDDYELSSGAINPANYISKRTACEGDGLAGRKGLQAGDEWIFNEYLLLKCGSYTNPKETDALQYQLEYILEGKDCDVDNLKAVVDKLLLMREVANATYLFSDASKVSQAQVLAATVAAAVKVPALEEPIKYSLLYAWAYAESVYDVRVLLQEGKIPLIKSAESWHYGFSEMFQFATDTVVDTENSEGLSYKDYLRIFLALENTDTKTLRAMDVIEMDVRSYPGNTYFQLDHCVDYIRAQVYASSSYGYSYNITREYFYY